MTTNFDHIINMTFMNEEEHGKRLLRVVRLIGSADCEIEEVHSSPSGMAKRWYTSAEKIAKLVAHHAKRSHLWLKYELESVIDAKNQKGYITVYNQDGNWQSAKVHIQATECYWCESMIIKHDQKYTVISIDTGYVKQGEDLDQIWQEFI